MPFINTWIWKRVNLLQRTITVYLWTAKVTIRDNFEWSRPKGLFSKTLLQPSILIYNYDQLIFTCREVGHKQVRLALGWAPRSSGHRSCRSLAELPYCAISTDMQVPAGQRRLTCWSSHAAFWNVFNVPDNSAATEHIHLLYVLTTLLSKKCKHLIVIPSIITKRNERKLWTLRNSKLRTTNSNEMSTRNLITDYITTPFR